jgi:hypothetical protein
MIEPFGEAVGEGAAVQGHINENLAILTLSIPASKTIKLSPDCGQTTPLTRCSPELSRRTSDNDDVFA